MHQYKFWNVFCCKFSLLQFCQIFLRSVNYTQNNRKNKKGARFFETQCTCPKHQSYVWFEPWQTCLSCKCSLLLSSQADPSCPALIGHGVSDNTYPCICDVPSWLLQFSSCRVTKDHNRQVAVGPEFCCPYRQQHSLSRLLHDELHWLDVTDHIWSSSLCWCTVVVVFLV